MLIKDLLLVLTAGHPHRPALSVAASLAKAHDAKVHCLCIVPTVEPSLAECFALGTEAASDVINHLRSQEEHLPRPIEGAFDELIHGAGLSGEICELGEAPGKRAAVVRANVADLVIMPRPHIYDAPDRHIIEAILQTSGTPVLLVPRDAHSTEMPAHHVALAWDESAPAKRAMDSGLNFLLAASAVTILAAGTQNSDRRRDAYACRDHLQRHAIKAEIVKLETTGSDVGSAIVERCIADGVDLLIAGAFGTSPLRETVMGGTTHKLLRDTAVLTLLAH